MSNNFPGQNDTLDVLGHRCASSAVMAALVSANLGHPIASQNLMEFIHDWIEKSLEGHPDKIEILARAMHFAEEILKQRSRVPIGYEDA